MKRNKELSNSILEDKLICSAITMMCVNFRKRIENEGKVSGRYYFCTVSEVNKEEFIIKISNSSMEEGILNPRTTQAQRLALQKIVDNNILTVNNSISVLLLCGIIGVSRTFTYVINPETYLEEITDCTSVSIQITSKNICIVVNKRKVVAVYPRK